MDESIFEIPQISKDEHMVIADLNLFYELFLLDRINVIHQTLLILDTITKKILLICFVV